MSSVFKENLLSLSSGAMRLFPITGSFQIFYLVVPKVQPSTNFISPRESFSSFYLFLSLDVSVNLSFLFFILFLD